MGPTLRFWMSDSMVRLVTTLVLLVHGLGHGGALGALAWIALRPTDNTGAWTAARSWLAPALDAGIATYAASAVWIVSLVGFVLASVGLWLGLGDWWRMVAIISAIVSLAGIVAFAGTWPLVNTAAAIAVDLAVLVGLGVLGWSPAMA